MGEEFDRMFENWWIAHELEFYLMLVIWSVLIAGVVVIALVKPKEKKNG